MGWVSSIGSSISGAAGAIGHAATAVAKEATGLVSEGKNAVEAAVSSATTAAGAVCDGVETCSGKTTALFEGLAGASLRELRQQLAEHNPKAPGRIGEKAAAELMRDLHGSMRGQTDEPSKLSKMMDFAREVMKQARPLSESETTMCKQVFGEKADLSGVTILPGAPDRYGLPGQPTLDGNTINLHGNDDPGALLDAMVQLWQEKTMGPPEQKNLIGRVADLVPSWSTRMDEGVAFAELPREQQVKFLHAAFEQGALQDSSKPFVMDGKDYSGQLSDARKQLTSLGFGQT